MKTAFPTIKILGSNIHILVLYDIINQFEFWINGFAGLGKCRQVVVTGFHGIWEAFQNPDTKNILNSADLWIPDGASFAMIARKKGFPSFTKLASSDFINAFFQVANIKGYSSFFYGDTQKTLVALKANLENEYPGHKIAGIFSPPFRPLTKEEDRSIIDMINKSRPDVLWVGLGCPKQDIWICEHKEKLDVPVAVGVGAAFSFFAGTVKRAPGWIEKSGFEWLWRFTQEPKKLWKRDFVDGPRFLFHVALEMMGLRKYE